MKLNLPLVGRGEIEKKNIGTNRDSILYISPVNISQSRPQGTLRIALGTKVTGTYYVKHQSDKRMNR